MRIGIQISSLAKFLTDNESVESTVSRLSEMGCKIVQTQWLSKTVDVGFVADAYKRHGITSLGIQDKFDACINDLDYFISMNRACLSNDVCLSGIPERYMSEDGIRRYINDFKAVMQKLSEYGINASYHPVRADFNEISGAAAADIVINELPNIKVVPDTCQLLRAKVNAREWIDNLVGRIDIIHFKDTAGFSNDSPLVPVGEGVTDFRAIIPALLNAGVKYILAEQETFSKEPFMCMSTSLKNINAMLN